MQVRGWNLLAGCRSRPRPAVDGAASGRLGECPGLDIPGRPRRLSKDAGCGVGDVVIRELERQRVVIVAPVLEGHGLPAYGHITVQWVLAREVQPGPLQPAAIYREFLILREWQNVSSSLIAHDELLSSGKQRESARVYHRVS